MLLRKIETGRKTKKKNVRIGAHFTLIVSACSLKNDLGMISENISRMIANPKLPNHETQIGNPKSWRTLLRSTVAVTTAIFVPIKVVERSLSGFMRRK